MTKEPDDRPAVDPPPATMTCGHCGCEVEPGKACHCGSISIWAFDKYEGWYRRTYTPIVRIKGEGCPRKPDL